LGVKYVGKFNYALLAKWLWRFDTEEEGVWRDIIDSRYGPWRQMTGNLGDRKASSGWRDLNKLILFHA